MSEPWLTAGEVAAELKVSVATVHRLNLPHLKVGQQKRYFLSEVIQHLRGAQPANVIPLRRTDEEAA